MVLDLEPGNHTVALQWMKAGAGVSVWWSHTQFLDGFVTSRSLVVVQERFPMVRHFSLTDSRPSNDPSEWRDISDTSAQVGYGDAQLLWL
jgi:hypothetical protein